MALYMQPSSSRFATRLTRTAPRELMPFKSFVSKPRSSNIVRKCISVEFASPWRVRLFHTCTNCVARPSVVNPMQIDSNIGPRICEITSSVSICLQKCRSGILAPLPPPLCGLPHPEEYTQHSPLPPEAFCHAPNLAEGDQEPL